MNEIERVLDECLRRMTTEKLTVDQLLHLYPAQAGELRPMLKAAARLQDGASGGPRPGFVAGARSRLMVEIAAKPKLKPRLPALSWRPAAVTLSMALFVFASTTAFAQTSLPGEALYGWKLESELVWRGLSSDPVAVDLRLAERRTDELARVADDPSRLERARAEFHEVLGRLNNEKDTENSPTIDLALQGHQLKLHQQGLSDSQLDEMLKEKGPKKK